MDTETHDDGAGSKSNPTVGSARLEQAACKVLYVWAKDQRTPEEWIAALADLWAAVHANRAAMGWWNCQKHGQTPDRCTCGAATAYVQNAAGQTPAAHKETV